MKKQLKNPVDIFLSWFNTVPIFQQQYLARVFFLCTTENAADFALEPEQARVRLRNYISRRDFPLRIISRLMIARSIFDLILDNHEFFREMETQIASLPGSGSARDKIASLSEKQWEQTAASWRNLRNSEFNDRAFRMWVRAVSRQM